MQGLRRLLAIGFGGGLTLASGAILAADWPAEVTPLPETWRGTGGGLVMIPLALWYLCMLAWVWTVDWVGRDATKRAVAPAFWGTVCGLPFPLAALVAWWIPWPAVGITLMVLAWVVPIVFYAVHRNRKVAENERILTYGHGRRIVAEVFAQFGIDIGDPIDEKDVLPTIELAATGGKDADENKSRLEAAAAMPGFEETRTLLLGAVLARATTLIVDIGTDMSVQQEVDGVWSKPRVRKAPKTRKQNESWVEATASSREIGEAVSAAAKTLVGLAANASSGAGPFIVSVDGKPRNARLTTRKSSAGEQLTVTLEAPAATYRKFADLGMDAAMADRLGELLAAERGVIILSSPGGGGVTTTFDVVVETADRLLRDFVSIEDAANPPREIQNVKPVRYDARTGVTPIAALSEAMREYPRAIVTRDVRDQELMVEVVRHASEGRLVIVSLKAADASEAVARVLGCGVGPRMLGTTLLGSLSQRLVRRLCPKCREEVPTPPQVLNRLKRTAEELPHIRAASQVGCRLCYGSGYLGRIAVFELASGVGVRKATASGAAPEDIRKAAIAEGMRPLKDAAVDLVAAGISSLDEIQRALSGKSGAPQPPPAAAAPARKPSGPRTASPPAPTSRKKSP